MENFRDTQMLVALVATLVAIVALAAASIALWRLRKLRLAQTLVLGDSGKRDLVDAAAEMVSRFYELQEDSHVLESQLTQRMSEIETDLTRTIRGCGLVRYDAYERLSGKQSTSLALLDIRGEGVVISSIVHRDQARLYFKRVGVEGSDVPLSPEEQAALDQALAS